MNRSLVFFFGLAFILGGILIKIFLLSQDNIPKENISKITRNLEGEVRENSEVQKAIKKKVLDSDVLYFSDFNNIQNRYPFFIYHKTRLFYWSEFQFVPDYGDFSDSDSLDFVTLDQGNFVVTVNRFNKNGELYEIVSFIPIYLEYEIVNKYLEVNFNKRIFGSGDFVIINSSSGGEPISVDSHYLFSLDTNINFATFSLKYQVLSIVLYSLGIIFILISIFSKVKSLVVSRKIDKAFLLLLVSFPLIRLLMLFTEFPNSYANWVLFDSKLFASSFINPSMGDLLFNIMFLFILVVFLYRYYSRSSFFVKLLSLGNLGKLFVSVLLVVAGFISMYYHFLIFKIIYQNSQWSLDITSNLYFPASKVIFYFIFIINSAIFFLFFHIIFRVFTKVNDKSIYGLIISYSVGALIFVIVTYNFNLPFGFIVLINLAYFFVLHFLKLPRFLVQMRYLAFLYFFVAALASAIIGAYSVQNFEEQNMLANKLRFADQFLVENDNLAELLLTEAGVKIKQDPLITSRMYSPFLSKEPIAQKIQRVYLGSYFDKYNVQINLYNAQGQPFKSESTQGTYGQIMEVFGQEQYATDFDNLFFVNRIGADVSKRYIYFLDIERYGQIIGHIILDLQLKKIIPESVYPELLVDSRFFHAYQDYDYSYAVFSNDRITYTSGNYNYNLGFDKTLLKNPSLFNQGVGYHNYHHYAVKDQDNRIIVISSQLYPIINVVSNFSFLFLILVVAIIAIIGIYSIINWMNAVKLKFATKIQLYINLGFIIPLFVVSLTTLSLINNSFKKELEREYYKKAESLSRNIINSLVEYNQLELDREELANKLSEVSKNANLDANVFNIRGKLIASSQPSIYDKKVISEYMNPNVVEGIREKGDSRAIMRESIGDLNYNSAYVALKSFQNGNLVGILSIPFFDSENIVERQQIDVLSNIMNIFTAIFLALLFLSYLASKWLTLPLQLITQRIKKTTLSGENEPLNWNSEDEIGLLVGEYNRMLVNLEKSKIALAKGEKESAWREMAQQVAHEIKNPLTPMKLTLQHLERSLKEHDKLNPSSEKPIKTLLYQIENLSDIASSFSAFAKMPIPEMSRFELTNLVKKTFNLHTNTEEGSVIFKNYHRELFIIGDEQLLGRILSNIIINSLQSGKPGKLVNVIGTVHVNANNNVLIAIKDDGLGIAEEIRDKIFVPNFSTKTNGSGIGLAIAKHGIEHAGGKIWFESELGKGTTFFIEFLLESKGSFLESSH